MPNPQCQYCHSNSGYKISTSYHEHTLFDWNGKEAKKKKMVKSHDYGNKICRDCTLDVSSFIDKQS